MRPVSSGGSDRLQHTGRLCMQCLCAPRCLELVHWLASLPERASVKRVDSRRLERALWAPSLDCCRSVIAVTLPQAELLHVHRPPLHVLLPDLCGCRCRPRLSLSSPHTCTGSSAPASRKFGKFCAPGYSRTVVKTRARVERKTTVPESFEGQAKKKKMQVHGDQPLPCLLSLHYMTPGSLPTFCMNVLHTGLGC